MEKSIIKRNIDMEKTFKFTCDTCEANKIYNDKYDSYYCAKCDKWLEKEPSIDSEFYGRPDKPSKLTATEKETPKIIASGTRETFKLEQK